MNIVIDTNVLIAAFIARGSCTELYEHCLANYTILSSEWIMNEFSEVLLIKFKIDPKHVKQAKDHLTEYSLKMKYRLPDNQVCRDVDDGHILALADQGSAKCIITGDKDLLVLGSYKHIQIIKPGDFWKFEENQILR